MVRLADCAVIKTPNQSGRRRFDQVKKDIASRVRRCRDESERLFEDHIRFSPARRDDSPRRPDLLFQNTEDCLPHTAIVFQNSFLC